MNGRELIQRVYDATITRIRDIDDFYRRAAAKELDEEIAAGNWPELVGVPHPPPDPAREAELTRLLWGAILSDITVSLLWAIAPQATDGEFAVNEASVAAACATIKDDELKRDTGLRDEHVRPVLEKVAEALIEVVRAHGTIEIDIDRRPYRLRAAA